MRNIDISDEFDNIDSWVTWFLSQKSAPMIDKRHKAQLFQTFSADISRENCQAQLERQDEVAYLIATDFKEGAVTIIHHCKEVGGNLGSDSKSFGAIQGIRKNGTCTITPNIERLTSVAVTDEPVPTKENIMNIRNIHDIENTQVSDEKKISLRNFIPIPPFLLKEIDSTIGATQGDSRCVLLKAIDMIGEFDKAVDENGGVVEKAIDTCGDLLIWLYLVIQGKVETTPLLGCCDEMVREYYMKLERFCLHQDAMGDVNSNQPRQEDITKPLEIIANSSSVTRDYLDKLTQMQSTTGDKQSRSFKKLAKRHKQMLLVASSQGNVTCTDLNQDGLEFFNQSSTLHAQIYLNSYLEARDIDCAISSALATILMHGSFTWSNAVTPSGLSASVISSKDVLNNDTLYEGIVLDYSIKHDISDDSLKKLTKTQVLYPTDIESMIQRLDALTALAELFFGETSLIFRGLDDLVYACKKHKSLLRRKLCLDDMFIPKLLYSVDDRVNQWLTQCSQRDSVDETSIELVQFTQIILKIQLNEFSCFLPPNIKKIVKDTNKKRDSTDSNISGGSSLTSSSKKTKQESVMVRNENVEEAWRLKRSENWNQTFRHKSKDAPILSNGAKACLKFHVKGFCFDDCKFRGSHVNLAGQDHAKTEAYIKSLRE